MNFKFGRYLRYVYKRLGIVGIYFTCVYFLIIYLLLFSIDEALHINGKTPSNIPIQTTALPTSTPIPVSTIFPPKSYYMESSDYPMAFDIKSFVEDTLQGKDLTVYSDIMPINPRQFTYVYNARKCRFDPEVKHKLLILVKSAAGNRDWRKKIRKTWGGGYGDGRTVNIVFLLAATEEEVQVFIDYEARKFRDIVQENFLDSYRNNTYKTIMGYNWAMEFCPKANYLLFLDDDILINVNKLMTHIEGISRKPQHIIDNLYIGLLIPCGEPYRDNTSKWYISYDEYPHDFWPPYLAGGAFLMSHLSALKFQMAIPYVTPVSIDDSYLGIVARKLGIRPIDSLVYHSSGQYANHSIFKHKGKSIGNKHKEEVDFPFTSNTNLCITRT